MSNFRGAINLVGGGFGALDAIDGATLQDGDGALVISVDKSYILHLDESNGKAENPPLIISPDNNAGNKRWILNGLVCNGLDTINGIISIDGAQALKFDTTLFNTLVGYEAGNSLIGENNSFIGHQAGYSATDINNIVLVGYQAGYNLLSSITEDEIRSVFVGFQAGYNIISGEKNTVIGNQALLAETTGEDNTVIGHTAGYNQVGVNGSTLFGKAAGYYNLNGVQNTYIGDEAGRGVSGKSSSFNSFIGYRAGYSIEEGAENTIFGFEAGFSLADGGDNVFIGSRSGRDTIDGDYNFALGTHSLLENEYGAANVCIGHEAGKSSDGNSISYNILIGMRAGYRIIGNSNIMIGHHTGYTATDAARKICIGYSAGFWDLNSDRFILDNQKRADAAEEITNALFYGIMAASPANQFLRINAELTVFNYIDAIDGFKDNGIAGIDGTFLDQGGNTITVNGGIITNLGV